MRRLIPLALATMLVAGACAEAQSILGPLLGGLSGFPAASATPAAPAASPGTDLGLDDAAVAAALERLAADPRDTAILIEIADLYYAASDFASASAWLDTVLAIEPENITALLSKGAVVFNLGDHATAEESWRHVVALDPGNVEAHYDLGFLYLNQAPPDLAGVRREWNTVIALAPTSEIAALVREHLATLGEPTPSPAP